MFNIAIEDNLTQIKDYLESKGCRVLSLERNQSNLNIFDAIVVTGQNNNVLGVYTTRTDAPVIEAAGLTPQEVYEHIRSSI